MEKPESGGEVLISNYAADNDEGDSLKLRPYEGRLYYRKI